MMALCAKIHPRSTRLCTARIINSTTGKCQRRQSFSYLLAFLYFTIAGTLLISPFIFIVLSDLVRPSESNLRMTPSADYLREMYSVHPPDFEYVINRKLKIRHVL